MSRTKRNIILLLIIALTSAAALSLCGTNTFHLKYAAGILTMDECLDCHGGLMGKAVTICTGNECLYTKNHSIMSPYPPINKVREFAPESELKKAGVNFENGKITCLSCHNLTKPPPHIIMEADKLCTLCHIDLR